MFPTFKPKLIALITDFGSDGPYVGQIKGILCATLNVCVVDLITDLPAFKPDLAAYLLPQLTLDMPNNVLYLCVVDPGVGSNRAALAVQSDGNWFLGPDNGLLSAVIRRAKHYIIWRIALNPDRLSTSFHGRDIFTPAAIAIINGNNENLLEPTVSFNDMVGYNWPNDLRKIIYTDHYGNLYSGIRANTIPRSTRVKIGTQRLNFANTFSEVPKGTAFWYENAFGLLELAVNCGSATKTLQLLPGDAIELEI